MTDTALSRNETDAEFDRPTDDIDPRQLVLPYVDTAIDLFKGKLPTKVTPATGVVLLPATLAFVYGVWLLVSGALAYGAGLVAIATVAGTIALAGRLTSTWAIYPHERLLNGARHFRRRLSLPWGFTKAVDNADRLHGISELVTVDIESDGATTTYTGVERHDGSVIIPIRIEGSNTTMLPDGGLDRLTTTLTQAIDNELGRADVPFTIHSTTRPAESAASDAYQYRAQTSWRTRLTNYEAGLLGEVGEWIGERDTESGANETQHYLCVRADAEDITVTARRNVSQGIACLRTADGLDAAPLNAHEVCSLASAYWERTEIPDTDVGEAAAAAVAHPRAISDDATSLSPTPAERLFAPEYFDEHPHHIDVGESVARTLWVSQWHARPTSRFLRSVQTMRGVDLDVTVHAHPRGREETISQLEKQIPRIDAEGMDRAESMNVGSITLDDKLSYYILAYKLLQESYTQPWNISAYITVRAPDTDRLEEACDRVRTALTAPPAQCSVVVPFGDQHDCFRSAAPFGRDHFAMTGRRRTRATKTHLAFGGALGAIRPAGQPTLDEPDGLRWGRDVTSGETIQADPFGHGPGPHVVTVGPTGSGKTFSVKQATEEWYLNGDDRTVIYCDTQGGFEDVVEAFDAEHIVIDGETCINPFDIRPAAEADRAATNGQYNQFRLKVDETTEFFAGILRSHGVDPAPHYAMIERAVEQTFFDAGITEDPETHDKESPTPTDYFETLKDLGEDPDQDTFSNAAAEAADLENRVATLLNELSGFKRGGKYHHLLQETTVGITPDTDIGYIDMRHLAGQSDADKSVSLQLAVGQITQLIKQTDGETIFVIDEAHNLLHGPMVNWLEKAAREWRRYDAALWFVTQSPKDFVSDLGTDGATHRETILEQCSTIQLMNCSGVSPDVLERFGLPKKHSETVTDKLTPGDTPQGYSECVVSLHDEPGWIRTRVEASPVHQQSIEFSHRTGESYQAWMREALLTED